MALPHCSNYRRGTPTTNSWGVVLGRTTSEVKMGETPIDSHQMHPLESFIGVQLPEELITEILGCLRVEPINSHQTQFNTSRSTFLIEDPSESVTVVQLPLELIAEILMRLPVKSLLKCKCVSKSWLCLISSKQFIRSHYSLSSSREGEGQYSNHQLLIMPPRFGILGCSLNSALYEPSTHMFDVEYPSLKPFESLWTVGIVNGLVCLAIDEKDLFIWNPALRKSKHLPSPNVRGTHLKFGFGYDESNDDYKVVYLCRIGGEIVVKVYSLMADSWRRIEDFKGGIPLDDTGTYFGGKIHWSAYGSSGLKIVTLDMVSEKYGELQLPGFGEPDYWLFEVLGGRPFVVCYYNRRKKMDLWVMNKYGDAESWSKVVSIPYVDGLESTLQYLVCILSNGEIVLGDGPSLFVYHPKRKEFRKIELRGCISGFDAFVYVESLVWPNKSC